MTVTITVNPPPANKTAEQVKIGHAFVAHGKVYLRTADALVDLSSGNVIKRTDTVITSKPVPLTAYLDFGSIGYRTVTHRAAFAIDVEQDLGPLTIDVKR